MNYLSLLVPETCSIVSEIEKHAPNQSKQAIIYENGVEEPISVTYSELIKNANKVGHVLLNHGLKKGNKVLIMMPRATITYELYIITLKLGTAIIPSSEMLRAKDLQYRITHGEINAVTALADFIEESRDIKEYHKLAKFAINGNEKDWISIEEEKVKQSDGLDTADTTGDDVAILFYTSGTTGNPKVVTHSHGWGYAHMKMAPGYRLAIKEDDLVWATAALGWQKWVWSPFLSIMGSGATTFVYNGKFNPSRYLSLLQRFKINVLCRTPTEYRMMAKLDNLDKYNLDHLHSAVSAREPLNREIVEQFRKYFNLTVRDGYGQTESTLLIGFLEGTEQRSGSMGKVIPGSRVAVVDDEGNKVDTNVKGNIALSLDFPGLFKGCFKDEERTKDAHVGDYCITGDLVHIDEDGYFWFEGRRDDIIISFGYTIGPFEVEDALTNHGAIKECVVVASPHPVRGNIVKAFIILKEGYKPNDDLVKELQIFSKKVVVPYKYPRAIKFVEDLPRTNSGRVRCVELREAEHTKRNSVQNK